MNFVKNVVFGFLILTTSYVLLPTAEAQTFTSTDFKVVHPVLQPGHFSSSAGFKLVGTIGQFGNGLSTSGDSTLNTLKAGFLYYAAPAASTPTPTPEPTPTPSPSPAPSGGGPILDIFKEIFERIERVIRPCRGADLNCDGRVNIYDSGIMFYWWGKRMDKPSYLAALSTIINAGRPLPDINKDKDVDIYDLSIMLAQWTH